MEIRSHRGSLNYNSSSEADERMGLVVTVAEPERTVEGVSISRHKKAGGVSLHPNHDSYSPVCLVVMVALMYPPKVGLLAETEAEVGGRWVSLLCIFRINKAEIHNVL